MLIKNRLDKQQKKSVPIGGNAIDIHALNKIKSELSASKTFMEEKIGSDFVGLSAAYENRTILRWIAIRQITPYYALLSPLMSQWLAMKELNLNDVFHIDFEFYRPGLTPEVVEYFHDKFKVEFQNEPAQGK